jgi:hypothetical protein
MSTTDNAPAHGMTRLYWIADGGHEWLAVPLQTCKGLDISEYSYRHGGTAYLEGDCDAGVWFRHYGLTPEHIRDLNIPATIIDGDWEGRYKYARFTTNKKGY